MQRKTANVLTGSGLAMLSAGVILSFSGLNKPNEPRYDRLSTAGNIILGIGGATCLTGYVFYRASKRNNKMAASLSFKNNMAPQIKGHSLVYQLMPAMLIQVEL